MLKRRNHTHIPKTIYNPKGLNMKDCLDHLIPFIIKHSWYFLSFVRPSRHDSSQGDNLGSFPSIYCKGCFGELPEQLSHFTSCIIKISPIKVTLTYNLLKWEQLLTNKYYCCVITTIIFISIHKLQNTHSFQHQLLIS